MVDPDLAAARRRSLLKTPPPYPGFIPNWGASPGIPPGMKAPGMGITGGPYPNTPTGTERFISGLIDIPKDIGAGVGSFLGGIGNPFGFLTRGTPPTIGPRRDNLPVLPSPPVTPSNPNAGDLFRQGERDSQNIEPQVAGAQSGTGDSYEDRLKRIGDWLWKSNAGSGYFQAPDPASFADDAKKQAVALMAATFDPQIKALQAAMAQAEKRTGKSKKDIGDMYDALAKDYEKELSKTKGQYKTRKANQKNLTKDLKKEIATEYTTRNQEQMNTLKSLGIQTAARDMLPEQADDQAFLNSLVNTEDAAEQTLLNNYQASEEDYESSGITASTQEGNAYQAELMAQLENFLAQRSAEIAGLQGQKTSQGIATSMQLQQQMAQLASDNAYRNAQLEGQRLDRGIDLFGIERGIAGDRYDFLARQMAASKAGSGSGKTPSGISGARQIIEANAANAGLDPNDAMGVIHQALNDHSVRQGLINTGREDINQLPIYGDMEPEQVAYIARQIGQKKGYNAAQLQVLTEAMMAYLGNY